VNGGGLPMVTAESVENVGKATKFGGPALTIATTVFDMAMADNDHDRCIALVAGAVGAGGGWGGAEAGAAVGLATGPLAPGAVPIFAFVGALGGGYFGGKLGNFIGDVVCPY
jgi:phage tail tape-measure protein